MGVEIGRAVNADCDRTRDQNLLLFSRKYFAFSSLADPLPTEITGNWAYIYESGAGASRKCIEREGVERTSARIVWNTEGDCQIENVKQTPFRGRVAVGLICFEREGRCVRCFSRRPGYLTRRGGVIGCWSKETFEDYGRLVRARDLDAAEKFAFTYSMNGQCRLLDNGLRVRVEEMPFFNDNFCVRPAGEIHCLWTNKGWIQRDFH